MMRQTDTSEKDQPAKVMVAIIKEQCKGCELCVLVCPMGCLQLDRSTFNHNGFHPAQFDYWGSHGRCTACGICYMVCPDYAIAAIGVHKNKEHS